MGDIDNKTELTKEDKLSVFMYRFGILLSSIVIIYVLVYGYYGLYVGEYPDLMIFQKGFGVVIFWIFVLSVGISAIFLHLYSKKILRIIQYVYIAGLLLLIILSILNDNMLEGALWDEGGLLGKVYSIGIGMILGVYSAIGAKEAYCFKLREGYYYGVISFILVILHLIGVSLDIQYILLVMIGILTTLFSFRKLGHPLYYDIGDKSKYESG